MADAWLLQLVFLLREVRIFSSKISFIPFFATIDMLLLGLIGGGRYNIFSFAFEENRGIFQCAV